MDKCNKCLKSGNVKKMKLCPVPGSDLINFNSELHLCIDCYNELLKSLAFKDCTKEQELSLFERALVIFLNNLPEEGKERVFNHYAYGPFVEFKRKDEWLSENKLKQMIDYEDVISKHKKSKPKGLRAPKIDEGVCSEVYWINGEDGLFLSCPMHDIYDEHHCSQCKHFRTGMRLKNDVCTVEQSKRYKEIRKTELEIKKEQAVSLRTKPKKVSNDSKARSNREKIGSLEFGKRESRGGQEC